MGACRSPATDSKKSLNALAPIAQLSARVCRGRFATPRRIEHDDPTSSEAQNSSTPAVGGIDGGEAAHWKRMHAAMSLHRHEGRGVAAVDPGARSSFGLASWRAVGSPMRQYPADHMPMIDTRAG